MGDGTAGQPLSPKSLFSENRKWDLRDLSQKLCF